MGVFLCISSILAFRLILAHARPENLFLLDSTEPTLNSAWDDPDLLWNSNGVTSSFSDLAANPLNQDINILGGSDLWSNSDDLFASTSWDLTAFPSSCETEGSLTNDDALQARDGRSCLPEKGQEENIDLPVELFSNPEGYLRDNIPKVPVGQTDQPGEENIGIRDEFRIVNFKDREEICPWELFGPSNIPVCHNPYTGRTFRERGKIVIKLLNIIPCKCFVFANFAPPLSCTWSRGLLTIFDRKDTTVCLKSKFLFCCAIISSRVRKSCY